MPGLLPEGGSRCGLCREPRAALAGSADPAGGACAGLGTRCVCDSRTGQKTRPSLAYPLAGCGLSGM